MSVPATPPRAFNPIAGQPSPPSLAVSASSSPAQSRSASVTPSRQPSLSGPADVGGSGGRHERTASMGWSAADVISAPPSQAASTHSCVAEAASPAAGSALSEDDHAPLERQNETLSHTASDEQAVTASAPAQPASASKTSAAAAVSHARNTTFSSSFLRAKHGMTTLPLPTASAASSASPSPAISRSSTPVLRASPRVRPATATPRTASTSVPRFALPTASVAAHRGELRAQTARTATVSTPSSVRGRRRLLDDGGGLEADDVSLLASLDEVPGSASELLALLFPTDAALRAKCDELLRRENVDMTALLMMTQTHMRQMGLTVGVRVKLATAVYVMRKLKGLEVADRGLIDPNSRTTARRSAHPHTADVAPAIRKPSQPAAAVRAEKADAAKLPSSARRAASGQRLTATSPIKPRLTSPTKPHAATTAANAIPAAAFQRSQEMKDKLSLSTTAAFKAKFAALNNKYRHTDGHDSDSHSLNHTAEPPRTDDKDGSPRRTARRLLVERKETVVDNDDEERSRDDRRRAEEERRDRLRLDRERRTAEREQANLEAARKQAVEREEKEAERKRRDEEREKAAAGEKEKRRVEAERAKQDKHRGASKARETNKEEEAQAPATHQQSRGSPHAAAADEHKEKDKVKEHEKKQKERPDGATASPPSVSSSSSVLRRSSTPIVLKRNKKADGSSALAIAASEPDEANAAQVDASNVQRPAEPTHNITAPVSISKLSLPDIPLSYSTASSSPFLSSAASSNGSSSSPSAQSSSGASSASAAGEALAKAKARILAAKEARESLKSNSSPLLSHAGNNSAPGSTHPATAATAVSPTADHAADSDGVEPSHQQPAQQQQQEAVGGLGGRRSSGGAMVAAGDAADVRVLVAAGEHRRRISHVGGLIDQFETRR